MRTFVTALLVASLAVSASAQLKPAPKAGDKSAYRLKYTMDVQGMEVTVTLGLATDVTKVDEGSVTRSAVGKDLKVSLGGQDLEPAPEMTPMSVVLNKDGSAKSFSGGIEGVDALRMFVTTHFFAPTGELKEGASVKTQFEKTGVFPKSSAEVTYVGQEELSGAKAFKFTQKFREEGEYAFSCDTTIWAMEDGTVLKVEGTFKNLPIPAAGSEASGKVAMERERA